MAVEGYDDDVTLYTAKEVANLCQVTAQTVRLWLTDHKLKGVRLEGGWRIKKSDLLEFLNERYG